MLLDVLIFYFIGFDVYIHGGIPFTVLKSINVEIEMVNRLLL